jgi:RNA-directed DNA polymerase
MCYRDSRQEVTGLVVNDGVNVNADYRKLVRAMVHQYCRTGEYFEVTRTTDTSGKSVLTKNKGNPHALLGRLAFIDHIQTKSGKRQTGTEVKGQLDKTREMYRRFLFFRDFYHPDKPVVLCEGPTDNIYLSHAIHSLTSAFPELTEKEASGKLSLAIRLYKYDNRACGKILGLTGGYGPLCGFVERYKTFTELSEVPRSTAPVILVFDNDSGSKQIKSITKKLTGIELKGGDFAHLFSNLYVILTPDVTGKTESAIEDLFDSATLAIPFEGKTFDANEKADKTKHFGKAVFAHRIVRRQASSISFAGFSPLLATICAAIDHSAKSIKA